MSLNGWTYIPKLNVHFKERLPQIKENWTLFHPNDKVNKFLNYPQTKLISFVTECNFWDFLRMVKLRGAPLFKHVYPISHRNLAYCFGAGAETKVEHCFCCHCWCCSPSATFKWNRWTGWCAHQEIGQNWNLSIQWQLPQICQTEATTKWKQTILPL